MEKFREGNNKNGSYGNKNAGNKNEEHIVKELAEVIRNLKPLSKEELREARMRFSIARFFIDSGNEKNNGEEKQDMYKEIYEALYNLRPQITNNNEGRKGKNRKRKESTYGKQSDNSYEMDDNGFGQDVLENIKKDPDLKIAEQNIDLIDYVLRINNYKSVGKDEVTVLCLLKEIIKAYQKLPYYTWQKANFLLRSLLRCEYKDNKILNEIIELTEKFNIVEFLDELKMLVEKGKVPDEKKEQVKKLIEKFEKINNMGKKNMGVEKYITSVIEEARFLVTLCRNNQCKNDIYFEHLAELENCLHALFNLYKEIEVKTTLAYRIEETFRDIAKFDDVRINNIILNYIKDLELSNLIDIPERMLNDGSYPESIRKQAENVIEKLRKNSGNKD
ncbi:MAG: hypothetical protein QXP22_02505 [Candidatus Anstonellales archaeon]